MVFTNVIFLFLFLPLVLILYYCVPKKLKNLFLFFSSLFFYAWGEQKLVAIILLSTIVDYFSGILIDKGFKKIGLFSSLLFNISILFFYKYSNFTLENINDFLSFFNYNNIKIESLNYLVLPIGISFFTFQTMSYTIDVYKGKVKANYNFIDFACYVTFFPQLVAGPIVKYKEISKQLKNREVSTNSIYEGVERFIIGLSKKVIIADNCSYFVDGLFLLPNNELDSLSAWIAAIGFTIQIYFDFSGYSDMAIGLSKLFGFNIPENFNYPLKARSVKEFWRRWHISLSTWFRDYVYIPLGGNKNSKNRTYLNILIVFLLTGVWHGANWTFIVWGILHGTMIMIERASLLKFLEKKKIISHIYLVFFVVITFAIFRSQNIEKAFFFLKKMFDFDTNINFEYLKFYLNSESLLALILGIIFSIENKTIRDKYLNANTYIYKTILVVIFLISLIYVSVKTYNPFIYFKF